MTGGMPADALTAGVHALLAKYCQNVVHPDTAYFLSAKNIEF